MSALMCMYTHMSCMCMVHKCILCTKQVHVLAVCDDCTVCNLFFTVSPATDKNSNNNDNNDMPSSSPTLSTTPSPVQSAGNLATTYVARKEKHVSSPYTRDVRKCLLIILLCTKYFYDALLQSQSFEAQGFWLLKNV